MIFDFKNKNSKASKKQITTVDKTDWEKEFLNTFKKLTARHRAWDVWRDFIILSACSISNALDKSNYDKREKRYLKIIKGYSKTEQKLFPELFAHMVMALECNPEQDFLGKIFMDLDLGNRGNGQFFTPYHVCELMSEIAADDIENIIKENGYISINDPCCGAGTTLIAGIHSVRKQLEKMRPKRNYQECILIVAQDIDEIVALMCYLQISLLGVAGYIKVGNSLTEPISDTDTNDNYWYTPMYFSKIWTYRRIITNL